ncbi:MAG TPA: DUF1080 domain-containing protein [Acidobacteriota bacterium]|nr:DUF1080 domain-containing protein [Acidobacteriota bacterium]
MINTSRLLIGGAALTVIATLAACIGYQSGKNWPEPKVTSPGATCGAPPSDAVVLFDGSDLSKWDGGGSWIVKNGVATVSGGSITTIQSFGDCQLHVEWAVPEKVQGSGQERGNSGIFLQNRYEIQVLDSYQNPTYPDGQAGALYKQYPPLVNACRKPGEWQSYDIIFEAPRFDASGRILKPGYLTVLQNGVLIQNHIEILGDTAWLTAPGYTPHPSRQPLGLQDHGCPVRYRNIWIRELS